MRVLVYVSLLFLFGSCLVGLVYLDKTQADVMYTIINRDEHTIPIYDSSFLDAEVNTPEGFIVDDIDTIYKEIHITFDFRVDAITDYNNLFQTAALDNGLRMELAQPNKLAFLSGLKSDQPNALVGFEISDGNDGIELGKWYHIKIDVSKDRRLEITLDDSVVVNQTVDRMKLEISDVAVGTGFTRSRPFIGGIKNFSIEHIVYGPVNLTLSWTIVKIGLTLISILLSFFILFPARVKLG